MTDIAIPGVEGCAGVPLTLQPVELFYLPKLTRVGFAIKNWATPALDIHARATHADEIAVVEPPVGGAAMDGDDAHHSQ